MIGTKVWCCALTALVLGIFILLPVAAEVDTTVKIYDDAQLLTNEEEAELSQRAQELTEKYKIDIVAVLIDDNEGKSSMEYADDFFDYNGFGVGGDHSGILMLVDMDERIVWISTSGRGITVFTDSRIDNITAEVGPYLTKEKYAHAVDAFLDKTEYYLSKPTPSEPIYEAVRPVQEAAEGKDYVQTALIALLIGGAAGAAVVAVMVMSHGINVPKTAGARQYTAKRPLTLITSRDNYLHRHISKHAKSNGSSGGGSSGSSVHRSSSGRSHGGGGRRF